MKFLKQKKASHVGVMLSFVIFVIFLIFLYTTLEPLIKVDKGKQAVLEYLKTEFTKQTSTILSTVIVKTSAIGCFSCTASDLGISSISAYANNITVKNSSGANIPFTTADPMKINAPTANELLYIKYAGEKLNGVNDPSPPAICLEPCTVTRVDEENYIFESKIIELIRKYQEDYSSLKTQFKIPPNSDFGFEFTDADGVTYKTGGTTTTKSIYAEEIKIRYIDKEANINSGAVILKVW